MAYSEKVIDHYENPRNVGKFDDEDENITRNKILLQTIENRYPKHYEGMFFSLSKNQLTQYGQPPILSKQ